MAITEEQVSAILEELVETDGSPRQAFIRLGLPLEDLGGFLATRRSEIRAVKESSRTPEGSISEWTQDQLRQEVRRMEVLATIPKKTVRAEARIAEITELME